MNAHAQTLVFVPLREEMGHIDTIAQRNGYLHTRGSFDDREPDHTYWYQRPNRQTATVTFKVLGDMGNVRTAAFVAAACQAVRPEVVLMAGLAGSLDPAKARLGDVFVIDMAKTIYADKIKALDTAQEQFVPAGTVPVGGRGTGGKTQFDERKRVMGDANALRYRRDVVRSPGNAMWAAIYVNGLASRVPLVLEGVTAQHLVGLDPAEEARCLNLQPRIRNCVPLASEMVIDSQEFIDFLQERNVREDIGWYTNSGSQEDKDRNPWTKGDIPIVDMESYGFFKLMEALATVAPAMRAFAVRGVSDLAAGKATLDKASKKEIRAIAARNAAVVTFDLLRAIDASELSGRP